MNDWKKRLGIVYSTNPDYHYREEEKVQGETIPKESSNCVFTSTSEIVKEKR